MTTQAATETKNPNGMTTAEIAQELVQAMINRAHWRSELARRIKKTGLTTEQYLALTNTPDQGISSNELANAAAILGPSLSRITGKLAASNLITSVPSDKDFRENVIKLSRKGKNLLARVQ